MAEKLILACLLATLLASRVVMSLATGYTADDAFITYRVAEHIADGNGFVYNIGERVQGTSAPLFALLLSCASLVGGHESIPWASKCLSILADGVSLIVLWHLLVNLSLVSRLFVCLVFAAYPKIVLICSSGMEISLVVALMLLVLLALRRRRTLLACFLMSCLLVVRLDSAAWLLVCMMFVKPEIRKRSLVALALPFGAWLLFSWFYFGTIVPNTVSAKLLSWNHLFPAFDPVRILRGYFPFHALLESSSLTQAIAGGVLLLPVAAAIVIGLRGKHPLVVFPVFFLVYTLAFSFAKIIMTDWYYLPGFTAYAVTLGYILEESGVPQFVARPRKVAAPLFISVVAGSLLALNVWAIARWSRDPGEWFQKNHMQLGEWLSAHSQPGQDLLLEPIGYIGWKSRLRVHDLIGMVSPGVLEYRRRFPGSDAWFAQYLKDHLPTYIILQKWEIPKNTLFLGHGTGIFSTTSEREWFASHYAEVRWEQRDDAGEYSLFVQVR